MNAARIFVVGTQDIFRAGVITIAQHELAMDIIGDAPKLDSAVKSIHCAAPDLLVLDLQDCDLPRDLSQLRSLGQTLMLRTIVITSASTDFEFSQCIQAGVNGILCRNIARGELVTAIRRVLLGRSHYCPQTQARLSNGLRASSLTNRELEVLQFLGLGLSNKEIAKRLAVGVGTVKTHLININIKLNVTTRTEAVVRGLQQRFISI